MLKSLAKIACLIALPLLTTFCLNGRAAYADDPPTRMNQHLHKVDYSPARAGLTLLGQPLVQVKINGTSGLKFLVDTGSGSSIISTDAAKWLGLHLQPAVTDDGQAIHMIGRAEQATMTQKTLLEIGNVRFLNVPFLVLDANSLNQFHDATSDGNCDGTIGANIIAQNAVYLDGPQHEFGICLPGGVSPQQLSQIGMSNPYVLPLTTDTALNQWFVRAEVFSGSAHSSENLLLDTGSNGTAISERLGQEIHMQPVVQGTQKAIIGSTLPGSNTISGGRADVLRLGSLTLRDFPLAMRPVSGGPPVLGMDILSNYRVFIDFPAKKMYLQSNTATAVPKIMVGPQTPGVGTGK